MPIYVPGKVVLAQTYAGIDDPDAAAYITAVNAADAAAGQTGGLETAVQVAIHSFVKGCKNDGIWPAIKASCILAGARTLEGALVPLVGSAPTNVSGLFVSGDYDRENGLLGNGSTKHLDSNRAGNADPQDNTHNSFYLSSLPTGSVNQEILGNSTSAGGNIIQTASNNTTYNVRNRNGTGAATSVSVTASTGFIGVSRSASDSFLFRAKGTTSSPISQTSQTPISTTLKVFRGLTLYTNSRLAFYSIGGSLNLAQLDTRVTALINAIGAAIP
jgi:hypothetical protein